MRFGTVAVMEVFDHEVTVAAVTPKLTLLEPCVAPKFDPVMVTELPAVPDAGLMDAMLGVVPPPPEPAAALTAKLLMPSPWPPVQTSKPISTSISHHVDCRLPRATASLKNGRRLKLLIEVTPGLRT